MSSLTRHHSTGVEPMILLNFPTPEDSPTRRSQLRVRYALERSANGVVPALRYAHGTGTLTRDAWQGFRLAGATISATSEREARILCEALGEPVSTTLQPVSTEESP